MLDPNECKFCVDSSLLLKQLTILIEPKDIYYLRIINDIIFNEDFNIVSIFKDYLILDDTAEFLKRYYDLDESSLRLKNAYSYYKESSQVFPSYCVLEGKDFMFKNIQRK